MRRIAPVCVLGAFLGALVAIGLVAATPPPLFADFAYTLDQNVARFSDQSTGYNIVQWAWVFGDGTTSTEQNPVHTYNAVGTYTVTLTVTDGDGVYTSDTKVLTIGEVPVVQVDLVLVSLAMIILGIIAVAISRSNYSRIGAAVVVVIGLIIWVMGSG